MKALVYHGPGRKAWQQAPIPTIRTATGTDLHILKGDVPAVTEGRILGHEAVGTIDSVGSAWSTPSRLPCCSA